MTLVSSRVELQPVHAFDRVLLPNLTAPDLACASLLSVNGLPSSESVGPVTPSHHWKRITGGTSGESVFTHFMAEGSEKCMFLRSPKILVLKRRAPV